MSEDSRQFNKPQRYPKYQGGKRDDFKQEPSEKEFIFGVHPVMEAVESGKYINKILLQKGTKGELHDKLVALLRDRKVPIQSVPIEKLNRITRKNHQGVICYLSPIPFHRVEDLLPALFEEGKTPLIIALDSITDIRNFGAIARSAECLGADFIVIPEKGGVTVNADAVKTSAGALHNIPVCRTPNLFRTLQYVQLSGVKLISCTEKTEKLVDQEDFSVPVAIVMGGEDTGIENSILELSDAKVKIPMSGKIASLNVGVASGIVLYEVARQRGEL
jgi:23S rRNA (guanosine2251-2'-O)-methyltransferase